MDPVAFFSGERWTAGVIGLGYVGLSLSATALDVLRLLQRRGAGIGVLDRHVPRESIEEQGLRPVPDVVAL